MRVSNQELARFFTLCQDMLCIAGTDGFFKQLNPAWSRVLGWRQDELLARPYLDFVHPDDRDATVREASDIAAGHVTVSFDNRYRCRDGSYKWLQWTSVLFTEDQQIYAVARDISALKATEAALREAHQRAAHATQAKNEFLSRMSHDLRTPLNAIMGFAQVLQLDPLSPDQRDSLAHILRGGRHLLDMINEILDISRIESGRLSLSVEPVALAEVIQESVALIRPLAEQRGIAIHIANGGSLTVLADRQRLTQILLNLLANAVKYNREDGRVSVSTHLEEPGHVRIAITDTGAGIRADKLALLFTPFERLGAEQSGVEGTGLGLALSKGLAEAMNGSITAESIVDQGSTFTLTLPSSEVAAREADVQTPTPIPPENAGIVLYIEDNPSNVRLMERVLARRGGVELVHAPDGRTGLSLIHHRRPCLVFLDLHLPDLSGEEVIRRIYEDPATRHVPVAVLTADATPVQRRRLLAAGAIAYLTKPFDVHELLGLVDQRLVAPPPGTHATLAEQGVP